LCFLCFFLLSAAFLSVLRAAGPSLRRVSLCFGLLTAAAISCFGLVKVSKKKQRSPAGHAARRVLRGRVLPCAAPCSSRSGCLSGWIYKKRKVKKRKVKQKKKKKTKKRNLNGHAQACCVVCTAVFQWPCFFLLESVLHIIKKSRGSCDRFY
jgi:hypothetical protein